MFVSDSAMRQESLLTCAKSKTLTSNIKHLKCCHKYFLYLPIL